MIPFLSYGKPQAPENMWAFWPFLSLSFFSSCLSFWSCLDIFCLSRSFSEKDRFPVSLDINYSSHKAACILLFFFYLTFLLNGHIFFILSKNCSIIVLVFSNQSNYLRQKEAFLCNHPGVVKCNHFMEYENFLLSGWFSCPHFSFYIHY